MGAWGMGHSRVLRSYVDSPLKPLNWGAGGKVIPAEAKGKGRHWAGARAVGTATRAQTTVLAAAMPVWGGGGESQREALGGRKGSGQGARGGQAGRASTS